MKNIIYLTALTVSACFIPPSALAFEGRIAATVWQGGQATEMLYTVGKDQLRIEKTDTNRPHARNIIQLQTGDRTLLFPHNRSFVRLKAPAAPGTGALPPTPAMPTPPAMPQMPPGIGPQPGGSAPGNLPGPGAAGQVGNPSPMPAMPMPPMDMMEKAELKATGQKTNLLGYACEKFELRQRGEVMEIWATDTLLPFQPWLANQPHRFGPRMIEEQWPELLKARKLFPLRASLKFGNDTERLCFEVKSITPEKIEDRDGALFQPPPDYHELEPLPF